MAIFVSFLIVTMYQGPWSPTYHCFPQVHCTSCSVTQSCLTHYNPMDYSLPDSFVHGILQARTVECVTISSSKGSSWPRDPTSVSCIGGRFSTTEPPCQTFTQSSHTISFLSKLINIMKIKEYIYIYVWWWLEYTFDHFMIVTSLICWKKYKFS